MTFLKPVLFVNIVLALTFYEEQHDQFPVTYKCYKVQ